MAQRKPHRKSRSGCSQCKGRRVKCDEARPACRNCVRRQQKCSLTPVPPPASASPINQFVEGTAGDNAQDSSSLLPPRDCFSRVTRRRELHLMHHYGTRTCESLGITPEQIELWKTAVPGEAMKYDFLMDGILSLAALHYAHLEPSMALSYTEAAVKYQNSGIHGYRAALNHINDHNCRAVFTFSVLLMLLRFASSATCWHQRSVSSSEIITSAAELLKGVRLTTELYPGEIKVGMFSPLFQNVERRDRHQLIMPLHDVTLAMAKLRQRADFVTKYVGKENREVYISSIDSLETSFCEIEKMHSWGVVLAWPCVVSPKMVDLFTQGDPMARLIWTHYGVLLLNIHDQWWGKGLGVRLTDDLSRELHGLDPEWASWTEWPRQCAVLTT